MPVKPVPFFSSVLYSRKTCFVYLPESYEASSRSYPVLYLLHGMYGDETSWTEKGSACQTLDRMTDSGELRECIVVMPNDGGYGHGTFYSDWFDGTGRFEQYFIDDLVGFIDSNFRTIASPAGRIAAGLSMGGFGAVSLALRYPQLFGGAASLSGALGSAQAMTHKDYSRSELPRIFGPASGEYAKERDIYRLAAKRLAEGNAPAIYFDCGTEDGLYGLNLAFRDYLQRLDYPYEFATYPGGHTWEYWTEHLADVLRFAEARFREQSGDRK